MGFGMTEITELPFVEEVVLDSTRMAALGRALGDDAARRVADRAVEEVAEGVCAVGAAWRAGEFARMGKAARGLVEVAERIGMTGVSEVALDVARTLGARDEAALAAVVARLDRMGTGSLLEAARAEILP